MLAALILAWDSPRMFTLDEAIQRYGPLDYRYQWDRKDEWLVDFDFAKYGVDVRHSAKVNKDMYIPLTRVMERLKYHNLLKEIQTLNGCFNPRSVRGFHRPSTHAYALACDFNAHLGRGVRFSKKFVEIWRQEGFCWGGDWSKSRYDPMHFSYAWECRRSAVGLIRR